jgi:hypothetical protein
LLRGKTVDAADKPEPEETRWDPERKAWSSHGLSIPSPIGLVRLDHAKKEIRSSVAVIGSGANSYLRHLYDTSSSKGAFISLSTPGQASITHLDVRLGDIRGYKTFFHLYALPSDQRLLRTILEDFVPHVDAIVIATENMPDDVVRQASARFEAARRAIPVAVLAPPSVLESWTNTARIPPVFSASMADQEVFASLKAVAKAILTNLRDTPTGEPAPRAQKPWWKLW